GGFGGDQRPRQLRLAERGLARHQHEDLVEVGGEGLGAPLVLAEQEVAPRLDVLDHALVAGSLPAHAVADHRLALLAARVADEPPALGRLYDEVAAVTGHHQPDVELVEFAQTSKASALAAQMKSLIEMPPTECVLKRTVQRL